MAGDHIPVNTSMPSLFIASDFETTNLSSPTHLSSSRCEIDTTPTSVSEIENRLAKKI